MFALMVAAASLGAGPRRGALARGRHERKKKVMPIGSDDSTREGRNLRLWARVNQGDEV